MKKTVMNNNQTTRSPIVPLTKEDTLTPLPAECCSRLQSPVPGIEQQVALIERQIASIQTSPAISDHPATMLEAASGIQPRASAFHVRNGKIARLPKLERDMVNRMLHNHVPYPKIVAALDELEIKVTERNISNWKTRGGYQEWCVDQERQINLARLQDNIVDYLRKNDAGQLPEVGLQVAATQLSHLFLQPDTAQKLAAEPEKYRQVVDMLCRLSTHIQSLQKDRDEAVRKAAIRNTSEHIKREDEKEIDLLRWCYTSKAGKGPRDPDIPHRNELPKRDELPFREPPPKIPTFLEQMEYARKTGRSLPGLPAPQPKPVENPTDEKSVSA
jgi:hypothetical protein